MSNNSQLDNIQPNNMRPNNEEPVLSVAAKYLNNPKHQELKFMLEAKLKQ